MSRANDLPLPALPVRRLAAVLLAGFLAVVTAGLGTAQEGAEARPPADPPPSEETVPVEPPLPIDIVIVRPDPEPPPASRPPQTTRSPETISLSLREADLVEVLRSFAVLGGFNLVVDPSVKGTVTVELKNVRWELALAVILRSHGLAAEIDGRLVAVRPLPGVALR